MTSSSRPMPDISDDGRYVAYRTQQPVGDAPTGVYVWDREADDHRGRVGAQRRHRRTPPSRSRTTCPATVASSSSRPSQTAYRRRRGRHHDRRARARPGRADGHRLRDRRRVHGSPGGPTYDDTLQATVSGSPGQRDRHRARDRGPGGRADRRLRRARPAGAGDRRPGRPAGLPDLHLRHRRLGHAPGRASRPTWTSSATAQPCRTCAAAIDPGPCVSSRTVLPSGDWRFEAHSPEASVWAVALDLTPEPPDPTDDVRAHRHADPAGRRRDLPVGQNVTAAYQCTDATPASPPASAPAERRPRSTPRSIGTKSFTVDGQPTTRGTPRPGPCRTRSSGR